MADAERIETLALEVRRLRELISLMAEHGEQSVCRLTIVFHAEPKIDMVFTHSDELSEEQFGLFVANEVKAVLEKLYECGSEIERKESP